MLLKERLLLIDPVMLIGFMGVFLVVAVLWHFIKRKKLAIDQTSADDQPVLFSKNRQVLQDDKPFTDLSDLGFSANHQGVDSSIQLTKQTGNLSDIINQDHADMSIKLIDDGVESLLDDGTTRDGEEQQRLQQFQLIPGGCKDQLPGLLILFLMADEGSPFQGYEMLQTFSANGLHYSKQKIFQRYECEDGTGNAWFSVASATEPGTFNLLDLGKLMCQGLALFADLKRCDRPLEAFECFMLTAGLLRDDLGGILCDDKRIEIKDETIMQWRQNIQTFVTESGV